jgi:hypothetical protein
MPRLNTICGRDETLASPSDGLHERVLKIFRAGGAAARRGRGLRAVGMRWAEGSDERAGDPEPGRQYEAIQVVRTGREEMRDDADDEADHDDPNNVRHDDLPVAFS